MAISRILGASLVSDLDRQGVDLQFSTSGNTLVYMDFVDFRLGVNETNPSEALHVNGNLLVANGNVLTSANLTYNLGSETNWWNTLYVNSIVAGSFTAGNVDGVLSTSSQPNITSLGTLTGLAVDGNISVNVAILPFTTNTGTIGTESLIWQAVYANIVNASGIYGTILTADQPNITNLGNINVDSISIGGNITITGNTNGGVINADELYEANNRVLTSNTTFTITGDATGTGDYTNIAVTLSDTGVTAGVYGSADDEYADRIPKITVDSKGRITSIANVTLTQVGNVNFNDTTISSNTEITVSAVGNIYLDAQGPGIVQIVGTDALGLPSGDSSNRPVNPEIGYFRYNTDQTSIEYWDGTDWISPGVQPISSQVLVPDGVTDEFVLSDSATDESVLVMINGTLQQPTVAYQVTGNIITFSEVPLTSDVIEVRRIAAGATTVSGLALGPTTVGLTVGNINISGNLIPNADVTYDIGSEDKQWKDLYLSGNTIYLGGATLSTNGLTLEFTPAGSETTIDLSGDTDPASISSGASNVRVTSSYVNVAINNSNVVSISSAGLVSTGNVSAAYIIGDGSQLTGMPEGYTNSNVEAYLPSYTGTLGGNLAVASLIGTLAVTQGGTGATTSATALDNLLPSGEQSGYVLKTSGPGTYYWSSESGGGGATVGQQLTTVRQSNVATSGQTVFDFEEGIAYTPGTGQLRVYIDGVRQHPSAYTETSNVSYTLSSGVSAGTEVFAEIDQFSSFDNFANLVYASNVGNIQAFGLTVQSAIESLETNKAPLASPVFTGNVSATNFIGTASNATTLQTARTINGVSFNGSANITLPTVNTSGDQSIEGLKTFRYNGVGVVMTGFEEAEMSSYFELKIQPQGINYTSPGLIVASYGSQGGGTSGVDSANQARIYQEVNGPLLFGTNNTERVRVAATGNVGINTANPTATLHVNGNLLVSGLTTLSETTETLDTKSSVTGTVVHDFSTTAIWYYSSISGNVTANITNVPTTNNRITSVSMVVNQGGTGYIVNGLQIDGAAQTIRWQANTVPTASTNRVDVFTFSLLRAADAWTVLGSATSHG